jgi:hypothetical protein
VTEFTQLLCCLSLAIAGSILYSSFVVVTHRGGCCCDPTSLQERKL